MTTRQLSQQKIIACRINKLITSVSARSVCVKMSVKVEFRLFNFIYNLKLFNMLCFICGFTAGTFMIFTLYFNNKDAFNALMMKMNDNQDALYDHMLADRLYDEVRILCWVFTIPENHKTKAWSVKNTWGKRCNKLIFMSTEDDSELGAVAMPVEEGRDHLWNKTMNAIRYVGLKIVNCNKS